MLRQANQRTRITPAYAGKSGEWYRQVQYAGDHPRLCGEKEERNPSEYVLLGSPPPMRGKVVVLPLDRSESRITPAYAGKRRKIDVIFEGSEDHPRLCGEKSL